MRKKEAPIRPLQVRIRTISLKGKIKGEERIEFLQVEGERYSPLVVVRYAVNGVEQRYGMRLDLGKELLLDYPDDPKQRAFLEKMGPVLTKHIAPLINA